MGDDVWVCYELFPLFSFFLFSSPLSSLAFLPVWWIYDMLERCSVLGYEVYFYVAFFVVIGLVLSLFRAYSSWSWFAAFLVDLSFVDGISVLCALLKGIHVYDIATKRGIG